MGGIFSVRDDRRADVRGSCFLRSVKRPEVDLLTAAGLLLDPITGRKRGIYSFRHTYATLLVTSGRVSPAELGANMGTSLPMIDRHYYHFDPKKAADRLADTKDDR